MKTTTIRDLLALALSLSALLAGCATVQPAPQETAGESRGLEPTADPGRVVAIALKHVGAPYRWGGGTPAGFDCSGFVRYVYGRVGVLLPHNAAQQYRLGRAVSREELRPGDLVFFDRLRHNGIYIGDGKFIHSRQTGKRVAVARLDDHWYGTHWVGGRRL